MVALDTLNNPARILSGISLDARINFLSSVFIFAEYLWLSKLERNSKFFKRLFFLLKSIWLTVRRLGPLNAVITILWIQYVAILGRLNVIFKYPLLSVVVRKIFPSIFTRPPFFLGGIIQLKDRIRPLLLTSYHFSWPKTGRHFSIFLMAYLLIGCSSIAIPDFKAHITLPASGDGYWVKTVSTDEGRIPKDEWDLKRKRGIVILSEDWAILRFTLLKNCLTMECKQAVGVFDGLFYSIDDALKKLPVK